MINLLLSDLARDAFAPRIATLLGERPHRFLSIDEIGRAGGFEEVDIAFISRDVTGQSTKHVLSPSLAACYDVLRAAPKLQWVHTHSAGADRPVFGELRARGVAVSTSSGTNALVVAQTAIAGLLALARRFPQLMDAQRRRSWEPLIGQALPRDLEGQTAVLLGWGPIGRHIGRLLAALGLKTIVVRQSAQPAEGAERTVAFENLHEVLPQADWLIVACPLSATTRGLIDARALALLPPGANLLNVARGEIVNEPELIDALRAGRLAGAFLDVFAHEPLAADSPLWGLPNVIATPHAAGHSDGHFRRVGDAFLENLRRWVAREPLNNLVD